MTPHRIVFFLYPGVAAYDVAGPAQAFSCVGDNAYELVFASVSGGLISSDCQGLSFGSVAEKELVEPIDTLVLPGGTDAPTAAASLRVSDAVSRLAARATRIACVCTGAFLAAEAGLLSGHRVVTHWRYCDLFASRFRDVQLHRDPIWLEDGNVWSSAGVSAGVDLALALIQRDYGAIPALEAARELVVFFKRPGGQSQFSNVLSAQIADANGPLGAVFAWAAANPSADLRPEILAERAGMTPRTFARTCVSRTGLTPSKAIEAIRVQTARQSVEQSDAPLAVIASRYGFGDEQRMRRAFTRQINATPTEIRRRFKPVQA